MDNKLVLFPGTSVDQFGMIVPDAITYEEQKKIFRKEIPIEQMAQFVTTKSFFGNEENFSIAIPIPLEFSTDKKKVNYFFWIALLFMITSIVAISTIIALILLFYFQNPKISSSGFFNNILHKFNFNQK